MSLLLLLNKKKLVQYLLKDEFNDAKAAGSVNGTLATDRKSIRTIIDSENKVSISGGKLVFSGGKATPAYGDPCIWYNNITRKAGVIGLFDFTLTSSSGGGVQIGITSATGSAISPHRFSLYGTDIYCHIGGVAQKISSLALNTHYKLVIILRATGCFYFIKGGAFTNWTLLQIDSSNSTATLYPSISNNASAFTSDFIRIPKDLWLPTPLVSDGFGGTDGTLLNGRKTDGLGHAEGVTGGIGAGGSGLVWLENQNNCASILSGKLVNNPPLGNNVVVNSTLDTDTAWGHTDTHVTISGGKANFDGSQASGAGIIQDCLIKNTWYKGTYDVTKTAGQPVVSLGGGDSVFVGTGSVVFVARAVYGTGIKAGSNGTGFIGTIDNICAYPLDFKDLIKCVRASTPNVELSIDVTTTTFPRGIILNLDSISNPQNYVLAYKSPDDSSIRVIKCVDGVITDLISQYNANFSGNGNLRVVKTGTSYTIFCNNTLVGSTQTISDASIINNTLHGVFVANVSSAAGIDNFNIYPAGNEGQYSILDKYAA